MDSKSLNNFQSVSPKDQSCEIWLKPAQWFRKRNPVGTDRRTMMKKMDGERSQ